MAIKVLVVDDEPDIAVIFRQKFRRRISSGELEFSFAENGRQALQNLEADPEISLVFTDIRMPSMDGLTFLRELKKLERKVLLPLVVSAYDDMGNIREAMRQGAWDFVTKPIDLDDLERVLNAATSEIEQKLEGIRAVEQWANAENARLLAIRTKEKQQEFFENITHELRTPLTLILAPLESALGLSTEQQVREYLSQAQKSGHILLDLVNQLLDFAKVDAQRIAPQYKDVHLSLMAAEIALIFEPLAQQKAIRFETAISEAIHARTDPRMVGRILLNLLSNAFKFTPQGGSVRLQMEQVDDRLTLQVQDSGSGIPEAQIQDLFSRFHHSADSATGTGLGLALCKSLTEVLDGKIDLVSNSEEGAVFQVQIPLMVASNTEMHTTETHFTKLVSSFTPTSFDDYNVASDIEKPLIVVAEDHPDMRNYIVGLLRKEYNVMAAENGKIAWDHIEEQLPDLVVTDWMMPEMNGLELLETIRFERDTQHIPVILLTAKSEVENRIAGIATGAEAFLGKPFHPDELLAVVRSQLAHRERLRERFRAEMLRPDKFQSASMEDIFLRDLKVVMEKNLMNEQFGVETMADALAMSRRTLVRKITALTGEAPVKFIRGYRLERARQMLQDNVAPIWEIAVKTGFGSASYFTKCFKDHYGISPKEAAHPN